MKNYVIEKQVKSPEEIIKELPLSKELEQKIKKDIQEIKKIIDGKDDRKILIIGPCSAWPDSAVIEYAKKLKKIEEKVSNKIKIIMRIYTQKPRTNLGWTGPVNQPNPLKPANIEKGIIYCRKMMLEVLKIGLPIADEALFTHNEGYFQDILCWQAIGARSTEDQEHRIYASMQNVPVGIKNPTSGDMKIAINSIVAAKNPHTFLLNGKQIRTLGNPHAHLVLRGGAGKSNIMHNDLIETISKLKEINSNSIIIDLSHDNSIDPATCKKDPLFQPQALEGVLHNMKLEPEIKKHVVGFMVESFIKTGRQDISDQMDLEGLSITDACIGWEKTQALIFELFSALQTV